MIRRRNYEAATMPNIGRCVLQCGLRTQPNLPNRLRQKKVDKIQRFSTSFPSPPSAYHEYISIRARTKPTTDKNTCCRLGTFPISPNNHTDKAKPADTRAALPPKTSEHDHPRPSQTCLYFPKKIDKFRPLCPLPPPSLAPRTSEGGRFLPGLLPNKEAF